MVNVPTSLDNLKPKFDDLDVGELKTVPVDLKQLSDVVHIDVVKNKNSIHYKQTQIAIKRKSLMPLH